MPFFLKDFTIFNRKISFAAIFWFSLTIVAAIIQLKRGVSGYNNYLIFKGVFWHTIHQTNLFVAYATEYFDTNHYGPFFSIIIAPFAIMENNIGCFLWCVANAAFLFYAVRRLPVSFTKQNIVLLIGALEMMTAIHNTQFNPMLTAWIMLAYILVKEEKDFWATLFIAAGILTKLYGIVGLAFFLFSNNKGTFLWSFVLWMVVFFCLPMVISSPQFIVQCYHDWYSSLVEKNDINTASVMQGMTVMRLVKKVFRIEQLPDIIFLGIAAVMYLLPLLRFKLLKSMDFQLHYLAFLLIGLVIYSSSAESATFVIAMMGVAIWYILQEEKKWWAIALLVFALVLTSLSTTDFFPKFIKVEYVRPYALKALPCFLIWLTIGFTLLTKKFDEIKLVNE
jgi:Glycosyltransferase family 87